MRGARLGFGLRRREGIAKHSALHNAVDLDLSIVVVGSGSDPTDADKHLLDQTDPLLDEFDGAFRKKERGHRQLGMLVRHPVGPPIEPGDELAVGSLSDADRVTTAMRRHPNDNSGQPEPVTRSVEKPTEHGPNARKFIGRRQARSSAAKQGIVDALAVGVDGRRRTRKKRDDDIQRPKLSSRR